MTLRPATGEDVAAVVALERDVFGADAWSEASVLEELTGPRRTAVVADLPGGAHGAALAGYAVAAAAGDVVDLQRVAVHPALRRRGLAHQLLAEVLDGRSRVLLEVSAANTGALAFYAAEGFTEIGRRRRYYRDGSDALVMERAVRGGDLPAVTAPPPGRMGP